MFTLLVAGAQAFCGLYVPEEGKTIENHASEVIWARHAGVTTLTLGADFAGDGRSFGLLVPVPRSLVQGDVSLVDPGLFEALDAYTTPRLVSYTCDDFAYESDADTDADSDGDSAPPSDSVDVEARFTLGEYEFAILDTSDAGALSTWLRANGFAAPQDDRGIVQDYLDAGVHFLAARVVLDALPDGRNWLSPIRFSYASDVLGLPIRIGTITASEDPQELVIYGITDETDGELSIANYPKVAVEDECMWKPAGTETLEEYYEAALDDAFGGDAGWMIEYSIPVIGRAQCDPCTGEPLYIADLPAYGWDGVDGTYDPDSGYNSGSAHLTRLRVRYAPEQATEDLRFATRGAVDMSQIRFIDYRPELESRFPVCGEGMVDDPGFCEGDDPPPDDSGDPSDLDDTDVRYGQGSGTASGGGGCTTSGGALWLPLALVGLLARRRR